MMVQPTDRELRRTVADAAAHVFAFSRVPGLRYVSVRGNDVVVTGDVPLSADVRKLTSVLVSHRLTQTVADRGWVVRVTT
jgi:hypothetical protein